MHTGTRHLRSARPGHATRGFTLIELMITMIVLAIVMVVMMTVLYAVSRSKSETTNRTEANQNARAAIDLLTTDLRSAGYGVDQDHAILDQPPIAYIDSLQVLINANLVPFPDTLGGAPRAPLAYNPVGFPKPFPLNATMWQPPVRYATGAEVIRWTLDRNNDGQVTTADVTGTDAQRTQNPNDYVLVREVYGDSSANVIGNNGGSAERVALIRAPATGGTPALFTVYMKGSDEPYDWSLGPVPPGQLMQIERVIVNVVATTPRPDSKGQYSDTRFTTEVSSLRNVPQLGEDEYVVDGYVYDERDGFSGMGFSDPGIEGAQVRLGSLLATTNALGYYMISASAGTYVLRHTPAPGYGVYSNPDSATITLPPSTTFSFADTIIRGGWAKLVAHEDAEDDGVVSGTEPTADGADITLTGGATKTTPLTGLLWFFVREGAYTFTTSPPDSYRVTTPNPISGTMAHGDTVTHLIGLSKTATARVSGKVFLDMDKDGILDAGEPGVQGVWVGVTTDGGYDVLQFANTDAYGDYSYEVPANQPPGTKPYSIMIVPPAGHYGTTTTSINNVLLTDGQVLTGQNFGVGTFQIISLTTSRVLSLASGDVIEKDWNGNSTGNARKDADIILGAESVGTDQVSVWFNRYNSNPLFNTTRDYARTAPQSVLSLAADMLDRNAPVERMDIVTGTKNAAAGNFFVWFTQGSNNNEGYVPTSYSQAYRTLDAADVHVTLTADVAGGSGPDIIVGTNGGGFKGTFEIWENNDAVTPTFTRQEIYPPAGNITGNPSYFGDIYGMVREDFDGDGFKDLAVGTKTSGSTGEYYFFKFVSKLNGSRFQHKKTVTTADPIVATTATDVDGDGDVDLILGTQTSSSTGTLQLWLNDGTWNFTHARTTSVPGVPISLTTADLGGSSRKDIVLGFRTNTSGYLGGVRLYSTDSGTLPATGIDPTGGAVVNMVPAMTTNNFNYGVKPNTPSPPYLIDLAVGVKISDSLGALVVMVR